MFTVQFVLVRASILDMSQNLNQSELGLHLVASYSVIVLFL